MTNTLFLSFSSTLCNIISFLAFTLSSRLLLSPKEITKWAHKCNIPYACYLKWTLQFRRIISAAATDLCVWDGVNYAHPAPLTLHNETNQQSEGIKRIRLVVLDASFVSSRSLPHRTQQVNKQSFCHGVTTSADSLLALFPCLTIQIIHADSAVQSVDRSRIWFVFPLHVSVSGVWRTRDCFGIDLLTVPVMELRMQRQKFRKR